MASCRSLGVAAFVLVITCLPGSARGQELPESCAQGVLPGPALSLFCVPEDGRWNGELVVFAHGYVAPDEPLGFYNLVLPGGLTLPGIIEGLGYAFATTSYRQNGLAIVEGVDDLRNLIAAFEEEYSQPARVHVAGASEGGLIATLLAERSPALVSSVLAACGPIGRFQWQLDYFGDFRVLFDYFFPGVIPGSPIDIPPAVMAGWGGIQLAVAAALAARPDLALELMRTAKAAYDPANPATIVNTTINALWYNIFATNDAREKLGGNPFGNRLKWYFGSSNDLRLNLHVRRFTASPVAREAVRFYETSGQLSVPVVSLHTTADEIVPFWHELLYLAKVDPAGRGRFIPLPVLRYGHCNFTVNELIGAFGLAVSQP